MNPDERDDELLQEYLSGDSALSRLYRRGAGEQPSAQLDARIRGEARRAVQHERRVVHGPFSRHWMVPTSLAAVFVLSVSVVLLMPEPVHEPGVALDEADGMSVGGKERSRDATMEKSGAQAPAAAAPAAEAEQRREQAVGAGQRDAPGRSAATALRQAPAVPRADSEPGEAAGTKRKAESALGKSIPSDHAETPAPAAAAGNVAAPPVVESSVAPAPEPRPMPAASVREDPRAWLEFIAALLDGHDQAGAKSNLRAFRARYPDFPLSAGLAELAASLDAERP